jgi:VanZ family protein
VNARIDRPGVNRFIAWLPALAYMALIWVLSSGPVSVPIDALPFKDKGAHTIEYGLLAVLNAFAIRRNAPRLGPWRGAALAAAMTFAWGALDEFHQAFVPTRTSDVLDLLTDTIAGLLGAFGYFASARMRERRRA